ncbi:hypothetical protein PtB15_6B384 [Puccinia triticina]|nr:hypothetical protein PtB15_6B384 [Puccinia triticina]
MNIVLDVSYSIWLSNPEATEKTRGLRRDRDVINWSRHNGPVWPGFKVRFAGHPANWTWDAFRPSVIRHIVKAAPKIGHEAASCHALNELTWEMRKTQPGYNGKT